MQKYKGFELLPPEKTILKYGSNTERHAQTIQEDDPVVVTDAQGRKMVKAGTVYPKNDETARGLVDHDYYFDFGDVHVALFYKAVVLGSRLPEPLTEEAKKALPQIVVEEKATRIPNEVY